jgi:bifunctional non-homologous end joining protein LigD
VKSSPAPLPAFVEPMKAQLVDSIRPGEWIYEIKSDGYRALALRGGSETRIFSRNQKDLGKKFTKIRDSIAALDVQDAIIDGEIVALDDKRPTVLSVIARLRHGFGAAANCFLRIRFAAT